MPGFETAATLVSDVARELSLVSAAVSDVFASTDPNILQLVALLKPTGRMLLEEHAWSQLQREATITTVNGTANYALPSDYGRPVDQTHWNRTQKRPAPAGVSGQQWQLLQAVAVGGVAYQLLRNWLEEVHVWPTPTAAETIKYEYISRNWGAASFAKETPTANADIVQFDPHLFSRALLLRFLARKGFPLEAAEADYRDALDKAKAKTTAAPKLSLNQGTGFRLLDESNIPETGYGL